MNSFEKEQDAPEMETLANLAENLVYRLPGCTDLMVRKTIGEVYRDFCRRSCCIRTLRRLFIEHNRNEYPVGSSCGGSCSVTDVRYMGRKLELGRDYTVSGFSSPTVRFADWIVACSCHPHHGPLNEPKEPVPNEHFTKPEDHPFGERHHGHDCRKPPVDIIVVEVPPIGCETAPLGFIGRYGDAICSGVLYRLMSMSGRAWSDQQQAQAEYSRYESGVTEARLNYHTGSESGSCDQGYGFDASDII